MGSTRQAGQWASRRPAAKVASASQGGSCHIPDCYSPPLEVKYFGILDFQSLINTSS